MAQTGTGPRPSYLPNVRLQPFVLMATPLRIVLPERSICSLSPQTALSVVLIRLFSQKKIKIKKRARVASFHSSVKINGPFI